MQRVGLTAATRAFNAAGVICTRKCIAAALMQARFKTMKAAVCHKFKQPLSIDDVQVPEPKAGEVLVRVHACGVCHTDLHAVDGDWPVKPSPPFIPGHEVAGVVAKLGPGVTELDIGDRVGVAWLHDACLRCEHCQRGWETLCERQRNTGYSVNGGFAEYCIAQAAFVGRLPENVGFAEIAPIICAGVTTYKGLKETEARPGQWVAISGIGGLGHVAVQYAKAMGLKVVAFDIAKEKLDLAKHAGAEVAINALDKNAVEQALEATGGGAHGVLVTAVSPPAFSQALSIVRRGGTVALVGLPPGTFETPIFDVVLKRITVRGSIVGNRRDLDEALAFAGEGKVHAEIKRAPLTEVNNIFDALRHGKIEGRMVLDLI